jgi:hypothetical protein
MHRRLKVISLGNKINNQKAQESTRFKTTNFTHTLSNRCQELGDIMLFKRNNIPISQVKLQNLIKIITEVRDLLLIK